MCGQDVIEITRDWRKVQNDIVQQGNVSGFAELVRCENVSGQIDSHFAAQCGRVEYGAKN